MPSARVTAFVLAIVIPGLGTCKEAPAPAGPEDAAADGPSPGTTRGVHYVVTPQASLERLDVRVCFDGPAPRWLVPGLRETAAYAHDVRTVEGTPLPQRGRARALEGLGEDGCVDYWVDLAGIEDGAGGGRLAGRTGESTMVRPRAWMWQPDDLSDETAVTVRFELPPGMGASVPWPPVDQAPGRYGLDPTAFRWLAYTVLGSITIDRFTRAGATVELVTLDAELLATPAGLRRWAEDAVDTVALLFDGRFPRERLQLVVLPVQRGSGPVLFGMAGRGGGAGVYVFMSAEATDEELPGGWTTVHELLHHGMPFIDEAWMAEGWVSYYTELMRTRVGHRSEQSGWETLAAGFERGRERGADTTLREASDAMHETHLYQRVYWGGAAVALLVDVRMRVESGGARGLDDAMKELRRCCGDAQHQWAAADLLARLDAWYGRPLFTETAEAVLAHEGLPDVNAALAELGVHVEGERVRLDDRAEHAALRRAIMAPRQPDADADAR